MILTTALAVTLAAGQPTDVRLIRNPAIYGDKVVFTYASDLWLLEGTNGTARRLTSHPGMEWRARFSPDGKWIAFSGQYEGGLDVYLMPSEGGEPKRLTFENTSEFVGDWTPDGKIGYFSAYGSAKPGLERLWLVDPKGGAPTWTALQEVTDLSFSPDGSKLAFTRVDSHFMNWRHYRGGTQGRISFWDLKTNAYSEVPSGREQNYFPMWIGEWVYYISDKNQHNHNLYRYNTGNKRIEQLTRFTDGDIRWPSTDGKKIVFERNGGVHTYDLASKEIVTLQPRVLGDQLPLRPTYRALEGYISGFDLSPSAKRMVVEARGDIFTIPAKNGETRNLTSTPGSREKSPAWSPDGQQIAYLSDATGEWQIMVAPQMGGEAKKLEVPAGQVITGIGYSPTGKHLAYTTVDNMLNVINLANGRVSQVFKDSQGLGGYDWSGDGNWIAYLQTQPNLFSAVYIYDVRTQTSRKVTEGYFRDDAVAFDQGGKYLYLVSARTFGFVPPTFEIGLAQMSVQRAYVLPLTKDLPNPLLPPADEEPVKASDPPAQPATPPAGGPPAAPPAKPQVPAEVKIDFDGLSDRAIALPWPAGNFGPVIGLNNGVLAFVDGQLVKFDFDSRRPTPIMGGVQALAYTPDRSKIAFRTAQGFGISPIQPNIDINASRVAMNGVAGMVDPRAEWNQIFWEVWRYQRDNFYDPNMVGLNWKAVGDKYAAMLPYVGHRTDLNYVIGMLIGELGTGHAYITAPGDQGSMPPAAPVGMLGADYAYEGDKVKFKKIYRGLNFDDSSRGPLGAPGVDVRDGDFLLEIDGKPVSTAMNWHALLVDKVNKAVTLTVNSTPSKEGARKAVVRPVGNESNLRYNTWVEENRMKVDQMSNGQIGYMHVPNTSFQGIIGFLKGYYSQSGKKAWVIDERYNGGGFIPTFFIDALRREFDTALKPRHGDVIGLPAQLLDGPKAMLINEYAGSGGDMFPWLFKRAGLGPLIGTRTWGGLVGISGSLSLVDGGGVSSPSFGIFDPKEGKWIAENTGVDPDIQVDDRPDLAAQGRDPQLEKAIEYLMGQLSKARSPFKVPPFPRLGGGS